MASTSPSGAFPFFDLPAELRANILEYFALLKPHQAITSLWNLRPAGAGETSLLSLFLACSQLYQETSAIFYNQNKFKINLGSRRIYQQLTDEGQLFSPQGQDARRRMRSVELHLKRIGGDFERVLAPALRDMILCGSLRNLEVRVTPQDFGRARPGMNDRPGAVWGTNVAPTEWTANPPDAGFDMVHTAPYQSLVRLLADPDLENVELWVWRVHYSIWCPFHEAPEAGELCSAWMQRAGLIWAPVDVEALIRTYGDGRKITKVAAPDRWS